MTPKEKAEELIQLFKSETYSYCEYGDLDDAKIQAEICVKEIIKSQPIEPSEFNYDYTQMVNEAVSYWKEVKQELENL